MRHSCVKGGGGNVSWGRLALVFPGFARFQHVAHSRSFRLRFDKFTENSLFLRNGAIFGVVRRKNRSFCGMRGAICVKFSANFWKCFFLRPRAKCRSFCGTGKADKEPVWFFEKFQKVWPKSSVLRWEAFEELIRSPKKCTADKEPAVSAPVFGAPYQPYFRQSKFPVFWLLAAVGMIFLEKKWAPYQPTGVHKMGPLIIPSGYIYIYTYIYIYQYIPIDIVLNSDSTWTSIRHDNYRCDAAFSLELSAPNHANLCGCGNNYYRSLNSFAMKMGKTLSLQQGLIGKFLAIPYLQSKIANERRCAILVHLALDSLCGSDHVRMLCNTSSETQHCVYW